MNLDLNGLVDSTLPNVYVNKITLQQQDFISPIKGDDVSLYVDETQLSTQQQQEFAGFINRPTIDAAGMRVVFDMSMKIPDISGNEFLDFIFTDEVMKYITIKHVLLQGSAGRQYYTDAMKSREQFMSFLGLNSFPGIIHKVEYKLNEIISSVTLNNVRNLRTVLPNGTSLYELPFQSVFGDGDSFINSKVSDLASIVYVSLDEAAFMNETNSPIPLEILQQSIGKLTGDVIIKDGKAQKTGMLFTISPNQEGADRAAAFSNMGGQVWLGGVHKMTNGRYMAGNWHDDATLHPSLDAHYLDNNKIQDFRQVDRFDKKMIDFNPLINSIADRTMKQVGNLKKDKVLDNYSIFSPLMSSIGTLPHIKLCFGIDFGKFMKKHVAIPRLIDDFVNNASGINPALDADTLLNALFSASKLLTFRIYRKRVDIPDSLVNTHSNRELVYMNTGGAGEPLQSVYSKTIKVNGVTTTKAISKLEVVDLDGGLTTINGFFRYYTLTDFSVGEIMNPGSKPGEKGHGKFEYSIEIEHIDPTLMYMKGLHNSMQIMINGNDEEFGLKDYLAMALAKGAFNSYTGKFNQQFIEEATPSIPTKIKSLSGVEFMPYLDPETASPDSIQTILNIILTLSDQIRKVINTFSSQKIPKTYSLDAAQSNETLSSVKSSTSVTRVMSTTHRFKEIVDTSRSEAAYDFLSDMMTFPFQAGLKTVTESAYRNKITQETNKYFIEGALQNNNIMNILYSSDGGLTSQDLTTSVSQTAYSYLTVPVNGTKLPSTIKGHAEENDYNQLITNILRYKHEIFGDKQSQKPDSTQDAELQAAYELVGKQLQYLSSQGTYFNPVASPVESSVPATDNIAGTSTISDTLLQKKKKISKADVALQKLLSALINIDAFALNKKDLSLSEFRVTGNTLLENFYVLFYDPNVIKLLPNQIKALILATASDPVLNSSINYLNQAGITDVKSLFDKDSEQMSPSDFGLYWFRHFNLAEVQYLESFGQYNMSSVITTNNNPYYDEVIPVVNPATTYEKIYNSTIGQPRWKKVTKSTLDSLQAGKKVLCRLKKYNTILYPQSQSSERFKILELPFYNEYFFIKGT